MKKLFLSISIALLLAAGSVAANGKNNKAHLKLLGPNGEKINCTYCHTNSKIPKKKGVADLDALYKTPACAGEKCHPVKKK